MGRVVKQHWRTENGNPVRYTVENESEDDDYGILRIKYVPYRTDSKGKKPLVPEHFCLDQFSAESYITFGNWNRCAHCGSSYFEKEQSPSGPPLETSGQPA